MKVTRHISLDEYHIESMKPYLQKYNGNFCAALKEMINKAEKCDLRINSSAIDLSLFEWILKEVNGILIPDKLLDEVMDPRLITSMGKLEEYVKRRFGELGWDFDFVLKYDSDTFPSEVLIMMKGGTEKIKFVACMLSQYLIKNSLEYSPLEIKYVVNNNYCIKIALSRSNKKNAQRSLFNFFGWMDETIKIIRSNPVFWKSVIRRHLSNDYNMVTVHRNYLEDIFADKIPACEIMIETLAKRPVQEIPLDELLYLIKEVFEASRVVDRIVIDKDTIIVFHSYRNKNATEKLNHSFIMLLESNGHLYDAKPTSNMIMLKHRPDVGVKINEIINNLKISNSRVDQELMVFMAFLEGFKDMPDIPMSMTAFGRRMGISLMQEYEKENAIEKWDLKNFKRAIEVIDSKLHRVSEWNLKDNSLLYTIKKCSIAIEGNTFDKYVCHTARETFKGAMNYAFGNKAKLNINKLLSRGDNFCEVMILIPPEEKR